MAAHKDDGLLTWVEIARSISTLFSALFLVLSHLFELFAYHVRGSLDRQHEAAEKARVDDEIENLAQSLRLRLAAANFPDKDHFTDCFVDTVKTFVLPDHQHPYPTKRIWRAYIDLGWRLFQDEGIATIDPPSYTTEVEKARYADYLLNLNNRLKNPKETLDAFLDAVARSFVLFAKHLPRSAFTMDEDGSEIPATFQVSLIETLTDLPDVILSVIAPFVNTDIRAAGLFSTLEAQLTARFDQHHPPLPPIPEYHGTPRALIDAYLDDTPLHPLFDVMIPFSIKPADRLEHWHLLAPTGWGKTQTLQHVIYHDIIDPDPPALVIIEPKGDMVATIQRLKLFSKQPDRLVVIDPEFSPALNMFAVPSARRKRYSPVLQEKIEATVIEQYGYIFSALDADMSRKQSTALSYFVKLVFAMQGTIRDFIKISRRPVEGAREEPVSRDHSHTRRSCPGLFRNAVLQPAIVRPHPPLSCRQALWLACRSRVQSDVFGLGKPF